MERKELKRIMDMLGIKYSSKSSTKSLLKKFYDYKYVDWSTVFMNVRVKGDDKAYEFIDRLLKDNIHKFYTEDLDSSRQFYNKIFEKSVKKIEKLKKGLSEKRTEEYREIWDKSSNLNTGEKTSKFIKERFHDREFLSGLLRDNKINSRFISRFLKNNDKETNERFKKVLLLASSDTNKDRVVKLLVEKFGTKLDKGFGNEITRQSFIQGNLKVTKYLLNKGYTLDSKKMLDVICDGELKEVYKFLLENSKNS